MDYRTAPAAKCMTGAVKNVYIIWRDRHTKILFVFSFETQIQCSFGLTVLHSLQWGRSAGIR